MCTWYTDPIRIISTSPPFSYSISGAFELLFLFLKRCIAGYSKISRIKLGQQNLSPLIVFWYLLSIIPPCIPPPYSYPQGITAPFRLTFEEAWHGREDVQYSRPLYLIPSSNWNCFLCFSSVGKEKNLFSCLNIIYADKIYVRISRPCATKYHVVALNSIVSY